jgi:endo-1,4-beta-xylanase
LLPALASAASTEEAAATLRRRARSHGLMIGTAVSFAAWDPVRKEVMSPFDDDKRYRRHLAKQFNVVTPENVMKWDHLRPGLFGFDFWKADDVVEFAEDNNQFVHGHTLVWHQALPDWLSDGTWTKRELKAILREHIQTVVGHFAGRVQHWDVVNEAIDDDSGTLRETLWSRLGNPRYIKKAFRWARKTDPEAFLCYNDYNHADMEGWQQQKSDAVYEMVKDLVDSGVPIDCVGFQFHVDSNFRQTAVAENFRRYARLGLQVQVTELDVRLQEPITQADLNAQAAIYQEIADLCLDAPNCTALIMWGFTDRYSWVPDFFDGWNDATIMTRGYKKKLAFDALLDALE